MEFHELQQIVESNSRAIQATIEAQETERLRNEEYRREASVERRELREATLRITELVEGIANLVSSLDEDRPTILGRLSRIENKVDRLLEREE